MSDERDSEHDDGRDRDGAPDVGAEVDRETGDAGSAPAAQPRASGRDTSA